MTSRDYESFLEAKRHLNSGDGFEPIILPDFLFLFQRALVDWAIRQGRAAIFADCGLGKTPMSLVWAENVILTTKKPVLIVTPLAVGAQMVREGEKFGIECSQSRDGTVQPWITITNYERLHYFKPEDFSGMVCDESSAIKAFDGKRRALVTDFMRKMRYRLLGTATAAPNDYIELGTSSEALGDLGHVDMLNRFFVNKEKTSDMKGRYRGFSAPRSWEGKAWRFKGHAEIPFWRWIASWARAIRKPSDLGFENDGFELPPLEYRQHTVMARELRDGQLFDMPAVGLREERDELRRTIAERCERTMELLADAAPGIAWCHLNDEGKLLTKLIDGAVEVAGSDPVEEKEAKLTAFGRGEIRVLVTKPKIASWGLNFQNCHRMVYFPNHSYEAAYQAVRRSWRFGQEHPVTVDVVTTEGGEAALANLQRKAAAADRMFDALCAHMKEALIVETTAYDREVDVPSWMDIPVNGSVKCQS